MHKSVSLMNSLLVVKVIENLQFINNQHLFFNGFLSLIFPAHIHGGGKYYRNWHRRRIECGGNAAK